jgi:putative FmdB family regulatory protein
MPMYEYACPDHGLVTELRTIAARDQPAACPDCGGTAARVVSAPRLQVMSAANRTAWERNERSAHEPRRVGRSSCGHVHRPGESCGARKAPATTAAAPALKQGSPGGRPWMLGH